MGKFSFIQVCFSKFFKLGKLNVAFYDVFFFEGKCRSCYDFDSFDLILCLPKVGKFPYEFHEIKIQLERKGGIILQSFIPLKKTTYQMPTMCQELG